MGRAGPRKLRGPALGSSLRPCGRWRPGDPSGPGVTSNSTLSPSVRLLKPEPEWR